MSPKDQNKKQDKPTSESVVNDISGLEDLEQLENNEIVEDDDEETKSNNYDNRIRSNKADYNILRQNQTNSSIYS